MQEVKIYQSDPETANAIVKLLFQGSFSARAVDDAVYVAQADAEAAVQYLNEYSQKALEDVNAGFLADHDALEAAFQANWERCPVCDKKRTTICPICRTAGDDFELAFLSDGNDDGPLTEAVGCSCGPSCGGKKKEEAPQKPKDEATEILHQVLCHGCDDPFTPEFANVCVHCGHQFPEGFDPHEAKLDEHYHVGKENDAGFSVFAMSLLFVAGVGIIAALFLAFNR